MSKTRTALTKGKAAEWHQSQLSGTSGPPAFHESGVGGGSEVEKDPRKKSLTRYKWEQIASTPLRPRPWVYFHMEMRRHHVSHFKNSSIEINTEV